METTYIYDILNPEEVRVLGSALSTHFFPRFILSNAPVFIDAGAGDDVITGRRNSENTLRGGSGNDILTGGDKDDVLVGGWGNDYLLPGNGEDQINIFRGGGHNIVDLVEDYAAVDTLSVFHNSDDQIRSYEVRNFGAEDVIDLTRSGADNYTVRRVGEDLLVETEDVSITINFGRIDTLNVVI